MKKTVVVGMSGGVDSSVAALLLLKQGYEVIGVTMQTLPDFSAEDAKRVCDRLGISHYTIDYCSQFKKEVMDNFVSEYVNGRTPNPCVRCNRHVKWNSLLEKAKDLSADYVATGHYANIRQLDNGRFAVVKSATDKKDQTYALYNLSQEQLAHTIFPLGSLEKEEVRRLAAEAGLFVAQKKDSQDICFIPDNDYGRFLTEYGVQLPKPGKFVLEDGTVVGNHKGIQNYTMGQRKGLGIAWKCSLYVCGMNTDTDEVILSENDVYGTELICHSINYMGIERFAEGSRVSAKIRYGKKEETCTVSYLDENTLKCVFDKPVRAITPGQAIVFYEDEVVLGGGVIGK